MLETLYIHAFTHHNLDVNQIGLLHIDAADQKRRLGAAKSHFACKEMMFLSTCNRVEFTIVSDQNITTEELLFVLYPEVSTENQKVLCEKSEVFTFCVFLSVEKLDPFRLGVVLVVEKFTCKEVVADLQNLVCKASML